MKCHDMIKIMFPVLLIASVFNKAQAADEICTFRSNASHFGTISSPAEPLMFRWRQSDGKVLGFSWLHGASKAQWYSYRANPGNVLPNSFPGDTHYRVNLGMTTAGFDSTRYSILGYVQPNIALPNATFAGIYEGTGSAWHVAYGKLTCVKIP